VVVAVLRYLVAGAQADLEPAQAFLLPQELTTPLLLVRVAQEQGQLLTRRRLDRLAVILFLVQLHQPEAAVAAEQMQIQRVRAVRAGEVQIGLHLHAPVELEILLP
jgi:hypothetical protein